MTLVILHRRSALRIASSGPIHPVPDLLETAGNLVLAESAELLNPQEESRLELGDVISRQRGAVWRDVVPGAVGLFPAALSGRTGRAAAADGGLHVVQHDAASFHRLRSRMGEDLRFLEPDAAAVLDEAQGPGRAGG